MIPVISGQRGYYDCRISRPQRRGMDWSDTNRRHAIETMLKLMRLPNARGKIGVIRFRPRGQAGDIRTWHKLPIIFKVEPIKRMDGRASQLRRHTFVY